MGHGVGQPELYAEKSGSDPDGELQQRQREDRHMALKANAVAVATETAAREAASSLVKLMTATLDANTTTWQIDIRGIDLTQYAKLLIYPYLETENDQPICLAGKRKTYRLFQQPPRLFHRRLPGGTDGCELRLQRQRPVWDPGNHSNPAAVGGLFFQPRPQPELLFTLYLCPDAGSGRRRHPPGHPGFFPGLLSGKAHSGRIESSYLRPETVTKDSLQSQVFVKPLNQKFNYFTASVRRGWLNKVSDTWFDN